MDEVLAAHCRADLIGDWMYEKEKTLILSGDFHFRFSAENEYPFVVFVSITVENEKCYSVVL